MKPNLLKLKKAQLIELINRLERRNPGCVASAMKETDASIYYHDMKALIDNILQPYLDHGFLHRRDVQKVIGVMEKLVDKIEDQQFEVGVERTFWECMAIIEMWNDQLCPLSIRGAPFLFSLSCLRKKRILKVALDFIQRNY